MPSATSSQTIGPFWHLLDDPDWADLTRFGAAGETMRLIGTLRDGNGLPVGDACVEIWQADPPASDSFPGFGRCATDAEGNFRFVTLKPGPVAGRGNALINRSSSMPWWYLRAGENPEPGEERWRIPKN